MAFRLDKTVLDKVVEQNYQTLTSIGMTKLVLNNNGVLSIIDCSIFENCVNLKSLFLEGMSTGVLEPGIINVDKLPTSLEKIEIATLAITSIDAHILLTEFDNLKTLFFGDIGHTGVFGVSVATMAQVIENRKIPYITLYGSLNGQLPEEGISNGDPEHQVMINVRFYGMLEIQLNSQGYYEPLSTDQPAGMMMDDEE